MWEIVRAGGPLMWPIIFCSIGAAAIVLERLWTLQDRRVLPPELTQKVWQLVEANQVTDKVIAALEQNSPLGKLLTAGISPLLGLLGTVTGIIRSFNAIQAGGMGDPRALSGGIAEALIATVAGLCVAIPSLIAYRYLR